jgi:hypothetical protein
VDGSDLKPVRQTGARAIDLDVFGSLLEVVAQFKADEGREDEVAAK